MARINQLRVADVLDYERDIKGKRLIRLSAGVCSGKNYAFVKIAEAFPDLRILLITSRKNIVLGQIEKMKAVSFKDFDKLLYEQNCPETKQEQSIRVVCTNASIEKYFKTKYNPKDSSTYVWDKFDLIILDEAHALSTDAIFTDCFYTEQFLKHTYYKNPKCDIVFMSGTQQPLDWLFEKVDKNVHELDYFDKCVHLEPENILLMPENIVKHHMYRLWSNGERIVYFANYKSSIAQLTTDLMNMGVPAEVLGYSFNLKADDDNDGKKIVFPKEIQDSLEQRINDMNISLTTQEKIPPNIKIVFTTSKNKEGINILDDDIKTVYAETHNKSDLIQIAGRIRGNPESGTGIDKLIIISDARQFTYPIDNIHSGMNRNCISGINITLQEYKEYCCDHKTNFTIDEMLKRIPEEFDEIRYDYISEKFVWYQGRYEGKSQHMSDCNTFKKIITYFDEPYFSRWNSSGDLFHFTGKEILEYEWFKWSKNLSIHVEAEEYRILFDKRIREFLKCNNYIGADSKIYSTDSEKIKAEIHRLADLFGWGNLGFAENFKSLGVVLKKFDLEYKSKSHNKEQIYTITDLRE